MKIFKMLVFFLAFVSTAIANTDEITTALRKSDKGLVGAIRRMYCSADWLSVVMRESNILEVELHSLPPGRLIILPRACLSHKPDKADRLLSRKVLAQEKALLEAEQSLTEKESWEKTIAQMSAQVRADNLQIRILEDGMSTLRAQLDTLKKTTPGTPNSWKHTAGYILIGMLLGWSIGLVYLLWFKGKGVIVWNEVKKRNSPTTVHTFTLNAVTYRCGDHPHAPILLKNLDDHTETAHCRDCVITADAQETMFIVS